MFNPYWRAFNHPPPKEKELACIVEEYGLVPIEDDYRKQGVKEGWLILTGWHRNEYNQLVMRYKHI